MYIIFKIFIILLVMSRYGIVSFTLSHQMNNTPTNKLTEHFDNSNQPTHKLSNQSGGNLVHNNVRKNKRKEINNHIVKKHTIVKNNTEKLYNKNNHLEIDLKYISNTDGVLFRVQTEKNVKNIIEKEYKNLVNKERKKIKKSKSINVKRERSKSFKSKTGSESDKKSADDSFIDAAVEDFQKKNGGKINEIHKKLTFKSPKKKSAKVNLINLMIINDDNKEMEEKRDSRISEKRNYCKFNNIEDSASDNDDFNYFDYVPRWYSIHPKSILAVMNKSIKDIIVTLVLIFFPLELVMFQVKQNTYDLTFIIHLILETLLIINYLTSFVTGFYDYRKKAINYRIGAIIDHIYTSSNILYIIYEQLAIFFNVVLLNIICKAFDLTNYQYQLAYYNSIICKFLLLMNLNDWIQINPILETINQLILATDSKNKSKQKRAEFIVAFYRLIAVLRVVLYYYVLLHIFACLWLYLYNVNKNWYFDNNTWVINLSLSDYSMSYLYICSIHYILTTLLSVGYGDIRPYNNTERIFTSIFMSVAVLFYSFIVTLISSLIVKGQSKKAIYIEKKSILDEICKENYVNDELYNRISNSLIHIIQSFKSDKLSLVEHLPSNLKDGVLAAIYSKLIDNIDFFRNSERNFILYTCQFLNSNIYDKYYKLVTQGQRINEMYFIMKGKVLISMPEEYDFYPLSLLSEHEYYMNNFFESNVLTSPFNLLTKTSNNEIVSLSKDSYFNIKEKFPKIIIDKLTQIEFKVNLINELEVGARVYFNLFGTMYGFRKFSMERINNEIKKEMQVEHFKYNSPHKKGKSAKELILFSPFKQKENKFNIKNLFINEINNEKEQVAKKNITMVQSNEKSLKRIINKFSSKKLFYVATKNASSISKKKFKKDNNPNNMLEHYQKERLILAMDNLEKQSNSSILSKDAKKAYRKRTNQVKIMEAAFIQNQSKEYAEDDNIIVYYNNIKNECCCRCNCHSIGKRISLYINKVQYNDYDNIYCTGYLPDNEESKIPDADDNKENNDEHYDDSFTNLIDKLKNLKMKGNCKISLVNNTISPVKKKKLKISSMLKEIDDSMFKEDEHQEHEGEILNELFDRRKEVEQEKNKEYLGNNKKVKRQIKINPVTHIKHKSHNVENGKIKFNFSEEFELEKNEPVKVRLRPIPVNLKAKQKDDDDLINQKKPPIKSSLKRITDINTNMTESPSYYHNFSNDLLICKGKDKDK